MVLGAVSAIRYTDMKALLAYATISVLGMLTMLLAFQEEYALEAFVLTVLAHALYKAPLFLSAGIVDHAMGTRDLRRLAGLGRALPVVAAVAIIAGLSMAGAPPTWGFLAKELLLEKFYTSLNMATRWSAGSALRFPRCRPSFWVAPSSR